MDIIFDIWIFNFGPKFLMDSSLLTQSRTKRAQAAQELRDREEVEKELSVVKAWIQETREFLLNPTPDIDSQLQELEVVYKCSK